jgi:hypothetical protein
MDIQQQINLQLFALFEKEGVQFAFPTQTVYVSGNDSKNVQKKQAAYPS